MQWKNFTIQGESCSPLRFASFTRLEIGQPRDSSVVLRPLLDQPKRLKVWGEWEAAYSSELLGVKCRRAIDRLRLEGLYDIDLLFATHDPQQAVADRALSFVCMES